MTQGTEATAANSPHIETVRVKPLEPATASYQFRLGDGNVDLMKAYRLSGEQGIGALLERGGKAPACHQPDLDQLAEQSDQPPSVCSLTSRPDGPNYDTLVLQPSHVEQAAALARLLHQSVEIMIN